MRSTEKQHGWRGSRTVALGLLLGVTALAATVTRISVNGRVVPGIVVDIGGQTYVRNQASGTGSRREMKEWRTRRLPSPKKGSQTVGTIPN